MILIDTSAWIEFFRDRGPYARAVDALLERNEVATCGPVLTELRRGLRAKAQRVQVLGLLGGCISLPDPVDLWRDAGELGAFLGGKGANIKSFELLIATFAIAHRVPILSADADFSTMQKLGAPLLLAAL